MVTNTVNDLAPNAGAWNFVLNAQGRIQGDLTVWRSGDALDLEIAADQYDRLLAHFNHFIIMDDVELIPLDSLTAIGLAGPRAAETLMQLDLPAPEEPLTHARSAWRDYGLSVARAWSPIVPRFELWIPPTALEPLWHSLREQGARPIGTATLEAFRVAEAIPAYGIDIQERDLPQETAQTRALHFSKGCYLGQEIVERIRSRGNVHRHLCQLELTGPLPAPGTGLFLEGQSAEPDQAATPAAGKDAGQIRSVATLHLPAGPRTFALAMLRSEAETGDPVLTYSTDTGTGTARILAAPPALA
jgi:folate-binding protein YgfZ